MKYLYLPVLFCFVAACLKKDQQPESAVSVLTRHTWYINEIKTTVYNETSNHLDQDAINTAEDCMQQEAFRFLNDGVFERTMYCNFSDPMKIQGNWSLSVDSFLTSHYQYALSPATGYSTIDFGLGICKLLDVDDTHLTLLRTEWYFSSGNRIRRETTLFCKRRE